MQKIHEVNDVLKIQNLISISSSGRRADLPNILNTDSYFYANMSTCHDQ